MSHQKIATSFNTQEDIVILTLMTGEEDSEGEIQWQEQESRTFDFEKLPEDIAQKCKLFGLQQALQQRSSKKTSVEKLDEMEGIFQRFQEGEWTQRKSYGGGPVPLYARAVARAKGIPESTAYQALQSYSEDQRKKIMENPSVKDAMEEIKREMDEKAGGNAPDLSDLMG